MDPSSFLPSRELTFTCPTTGQHVRFTITDDRFVGIADDPLVAPDQTPGGIYEIVKCPACQGTHVLHRPSEAGHPSWIA